MPAIAENALVKAAPLVERLAALRPEPRIEPEVAAFLRLLTGRDVGPGDALEVARGIDPLAAELIEPLLALTVAPTIISASQKRNVIPAVCELVCDCRLLPGQAQAEAEGLIRRALGDVDYGFFPMRAMNPQVASRLIHSADERAAVEDLELGVRFLRFAAQSLLA